MAAELLKRLFLAEIKPELFPNNGFMSQSVNDDAFVNNNTVELQNAGTIPDVIVDRTVLPAPIHQRDDVAHNYALEELTTDPTLIKDSEALVEMGGAQKRASVLLQHSRKQNTKMADRALVNWALAVATADKVPTTGAARPATAPSATGNRKKITRADILNVLEVLALQDYEGGTLNAILAPAMYRDLFELDEFIHAEKLGSTQAVREGFIGRILGIDIWQRSRVLVTDASDVVKAEGAAGAATDQLAALFWHSQAVRRAMGSVKVYIEIDKPGLYGSVFSTMVRFGAQKDRNDGKGIALLFEDT